MRRLWWLWTAALLSALALLGMVALPDWASTLTIAWLLGLIAIAAAALAAPDGASVVVYGPHGQSARVSEREALRRVAGQGWSYEPIDDRVDS